MNAHDIKRYIIENNKIEEILEEIGCHSIKYHSSGYYTAGNKDGDNKQAITIYSPGLNIVNYTRQLPQPSDLITLIEYNLNLNFFHAHKWLHNFLGLDFYSDGEPDLPESIKITRMLISMKGKASLYEDDTPVKPIDPKILSYYHPYINDLFLNDGISYNTQAEFQIGYDDYSNRITIPIFDETNTLVGIKGRLFKEHISEDELKYIYLEPCSKSKILYGFYKTYPYIKEQGKTYITESEKGVMQLWSYGYRNCIGLGGKQISRTQIEKISRLGVEIVLCLDQDVSQKELENIANQFIDGFSVSAIMDTQGILEEKESPSDNKEKWEHLIKNCIYKLK